MLISDFTPLLPAAIPIKGLFLVYRAVTCSESFELPANSGRDTRLFGVQVVPRRGKTKSHPGLSAWRIAPLTQTTRSSAKFRQLTRADRDETQDLGGTQHVPQGANQAQTLGFDVQLAGSPGIGGAPEFGPTSPALRVSALWRQDDSVESGSGSWSAMP